MHCIAYFLVDESLFLESTIEEFSFLSIYWACEPRDIVVCTNDSLTLAIGAWENLQSIFFVLYAGAWFFFQKRKQISSGIIYYRSQCYTVTSSLLFINKMTCSYHNDFRCAMSKFIIVRSLEQTADAVHVMNFFNSLSDKKQIWSVLIYGWWQKSFVFERGQVIKSQTACRS